MPAINTLNINGVEYTVENSNKTRTAFEDKGDLYSLLATVEKMNMAKIGKSLSTSCTEQQTDGSTIHFFDQTLLPYARILVRCLAKNWSTFAYYNPRTNTYTEISSFSGSNTNRLIQFDQIPNGCYFAFSASDSLYKDGYYKYLGRIYINPNYTPKFEGLDEPLSNDLIPVDLAPTAYNGYPYFYVDMSKYENVMIRIIQHSGATMWAYAGETLIDTTQSITGVATSGSFFPWIYQKRYLIFAFTNADFVSNNANISVGWINPEIAIQQKRKRYFGSRLAAHNADTATELVHSCVWADIVDLDICRTLDGKYVLIHNNVINGHTIAETNLADLGLTYNQLDLDRAIKIMQLYNTTCFNNLWSATPEQYANEAVEKLYNSLGKLYIYDAYVQQNSPLYGHVSKFYCWHSTNTIEFDVEAGFPIDRIVSGPVTSETYNMHDWITSGQIDSISSAADLRNNDVYDIWFIYSGLTNLLNG